MSLTAQCVKSRSETASWTSLFEDVETSSTKSVLFMKKLLALGVSNILYWRGFLPESAFGERMVGENCLKILRNEKDCPAALKIISWIKASFEPIAKSWLRNFYLVIRDCEGTNTVECYTFKFQYVDDDIQAQVLRNNKVVSVVEDSTLKMLSNIAAIVKPLGPAPFPCMISIDMDFNQPSPRAEIPKEASIPGFVQVEELQHKFDGKRIAVNLGDIGTSYHDCKLQIRTTASHLSIGTEAADSQKLAGSKRTSQESEVCSTNEKPDKKIYKDQIACPCETENKVLTLVGCSGCNKSHHRLCYGYRKESSTGDFYCVKCSPELKKKYHKDKKSFKTLALIRQALALLLEDKAKVDHQLITHNPCITEQLIKDKVLITNRKSGGHQIDKKALMKAQIQYFKE